MTERPRFTDAPGLKVKPRKDGWRLVWVPRDDAVKAGYPSGTVNLSRLYDGSQNGKQAISSRCQRLQDQMLYWLGGHRRDRNRYDGTIRSVIDQYETHPKSTFHQLSHGSRKPYIVYLGRIKRLYGERYVPDLSALDIGDWYATLAGCDDHGRPTKPGAGSMAMKVLKETLRFAKVCGAVECAALLETVRELRFASPRPRRHVATAKQVEAARRAAHAHNHPSRALAYAIQFETALRLWDVTGQWVPLASPVLSDVTNGAWKWAGLRWEHIDPDLVLRYTPSKTAKTTGKEMVINLAELPMVVEELQNWAGARPGPVIVNEFSGLPYTDQQFRRGWRRDFKAAGLPLGLWGRDLRASAVTEARAGGAATDDAAKAAGHAKPKITAEVYDRDQLAARRRVAEARKTHREQQ